MRVLFAFTLLTLAIVSFSLLILTFQILWPPDVKNQLIGKDLILGRWRAGGGGATVDEIVGWHHRLNEHEFEQT